MTTTAASSVFSFTQQGSRVGDEVFEITNYKWWKMRTPTIGVGPVEMVDLLPQEIGTMVPVGPFKTGAGYAGGVEMYPRMIDSLILLLEAAFGKRVTTTGTAYPAITRSGVNIHKFTYDATQTVLPWLALRRRIPGETVAEVYGDVGYDVKVDSLSLRIPASGLLRGNISFRGRVPKFPTAGEVNAWVYVNGFEDSSSIPLSSAKGSKVLIDSVKQPITSLEITAINNLTSLQEEQVVGSPFAEDFATKNRAIQLRIIYKWQNGDYYKQIMAGGPNGTEWSALPLIQDTLGIGKAFEATFNSPYNIPSVTPATPYMLKIIANRVTWQLDRQGIQLAGNNVIYVPYVATVLDPASGEYVEVYVQNGNDGSTYTWPIDPVLTLDASALAYTEGDTTAIDVAATLTATPANLLGGYVKAEITVTSDGNDVLTVENQTPGGTAITVSGANVSYGGSLIGVKSGGTAGTELVIHLTTSAATPTAVQKLVRALMYASGATPTEETRTATVRVLDGHGGLVSKTRAIAVNAL